MTDLIAGLHAAHSFLVNEFPDKVDVFKDQLLIYLITNNLRHLKSKLFVELRYTCMYFLYTLCCRGLEMPGQYPSMLKLIYFLFIKLSIRTRKNRNCKPSFVAKLWPFQIPDLPPPPFFFRSPCQSQCELLPSLAVSGMMASLWLARKNVFGPVKN